ncbi:MAG: DAK2 domain-containing protein [Eubacteriales bacterium]|nr:DAK2 domain-containing protein [Eubacteriales bacterium]
MSNQAIDARTLSRMFLAGAKNLEANKEWINELNVFPVPDGDTGTNMTMTIMSAVREVVSLGDTDDMMTICKAISSGSLRGARGNSGVILSQLLRGFCKGVREHVQVSVPVFADAFDKAVETAYKAVMKPKEGTILTVAKGAAAKSRELADQGEEDLDVYFKAVIAYADEVLASTPDLLPVLKQAGVVDSGGQGLMQVLKGAYDGYLGKEIDYAAIAKEVSAPKENAHKDLVNPEMRANAEIKFGYCTEFIIMLNKHFGSKTEKDFKAYLESIGDSIVCVADDEVVKVHVHTNDPGLAIQRGLLYGQLSNLKIDNMRLEHQETLFKLDGAGQTAESGQTAPAEPRKDVGFIAVSVGDGIAEIFKGLGVDYIISGGQTMNPSTEDVLDAIAKVNADTIFILPNNKNIILAANQAAGMTKDKNVIVIPTKTIPQGITAVINFMPDLDSDVNRENMSEEIRHVKSAEITYAVRNTVLDGIEIKEGDMMGIGDSGIVAVDTDRDEAALATLAKIVGEDTELISVYYGADVTQEEAETLRGRIAEKFSKCDVELQNGGQPIYYYILSAE